MMYNIDLLNAISKDILERKQTLSVAESCTSGHIQAAFSAADNATAFFQGGITVYTINQKSRHLQVDPVYALQNNGVSQVIAETMALQVNKLFLTDYGIGITGYAAPIPAEDINSLYAFVAIAEKDTIIFSGTIRAPKQNSIDVQLHYTNQVLTTFSEILEKMHTHS